VLLREISDRIAVEFLAQWERLLAGSNGMLAAEHGAHWLADEAIGKQCRRQLVSSLETYRDSLSAAQADQWMQAVAVRLPTDAAAVWEATVARRSRQSRGFSLRSPQRKAEL
jgi:hypothetical protein